MKNKFDSTSEEEISEKITKEKFQEDQHRKITKEQKIRAEEILKESLK